MFRVLGRATAALVLFYAWLPAALACDYQLDVDLLNGVGDATLTATNVGDTPCADGAIAGPIQPRPEFPLWGAVVPASELQWAVATPMFSTDGQTTCVDMDLGGGGQFSCALPFVGPPSIPPGGSFQTRVRLLPSNESAALCLTFGAGVARPTSNLALSPYPLMPATDATPDNNWRTFCRIGAPGYPVTKSDSADPILQGTTFNYVISVQNTYNVVIADAHIVDVIPTGLTPVSVSSPAFACSLAGQTVTCDQTSPLALSESADITIAVTATSVGVYNNTCTATNGGADPENPWDGECSESTTVFGASANLDCTKSDATDPVAAGAPITYNIACNNAGPQAAANVSFADTLPAGVTFVSASGTGWSCSHAAGVVTCTRASAAVGALPGIQIVANAPLAGGTVTNTCVISSATNDPTPADPNCNEDTTVDPPVADLDCTKTDATDPVAAGAPITYNIACNNAGPQDAANVSFADTLPAGVTFVSASGTGWSCSHAAGVVTCTRASAAVGALPGIQIVANAPLAGGTVTNTCVISSATNDPTPADPNCNEDTTVDPPIADLDCTKTDATDPVAAGAPITYNIACNNAGPQDAANVSFADTLPAGVTFVSASGTGWSCSHAAGVVTCTRASAAVGALPGIQIVANAPLAGGAVTNTCVISSATNDPTPADPNCNEDTTVDPPIADLDCTKTDATDPVAAGAPITYNIACNNAGPQDAANVSFADTLPAGVTFVSASGTGWSCSHAAGVVTCTRASAAVGALPGIQIVANAPLAGGAVTNTCVISSATNDPTPADPNCNEDTTVDPIADLALVKTDAADPVQVGDSITYTLAVSNAGPSAATTPRVTDTLPAGTAFVSATGAGWTCGEAAGVITCDAAANMAAGASSSITVTVTAPGTAGTITNTATVSTTTQETTTSNNTDTETTTVNADIADLDCTKTDATDPVAAGAPITYNIACNNAGPQAAANVSFADTLPAGVTFVSASGTGWSCSHAAGVVTCTRASAAVGALPGIQIVANAPLAGGTVTNTCVISSATNDPTPADPNCNEDTTVDPPVADLDCTKTDATDPVAAGAPITYNIACNNAGPQDAANVSFADTLPAGVTFVSASGTGWSCSHAAGVVTCTRASAAVGALPGIQIVANAPLAGGTVTNTCVISSATNDPTPADPNCNEDTTVDPNANLAIQKTDAADPVLAGSQIVYTLTTTNSGLSPAATPRVVDTLPAGTAFVSATGAGWTCGEAAGVITCDAAANMAAGASSSITVTVTAPGTAGTITNTATVSTTTPETTTADNTDSEPTTITTLAADLACTKADATDPVQPGADIEWTIACSNAGPDAATNVVVTDELPAGVSFVSATGTGWSCSHAAGVVTCTTPDAPVAALPAITVVATAPMAGGQLVNVCVATSDQADPTAADACDETTTVIPPLAPPAPIPAVSPLTLAVLALMLFGIAGPALRSRAHD